MELRSYIVPLVQMSSKVAPWLFFGGIILDFNQVAWAGVFLFGTSTLFTIVTLPVEIDASNRAKALLVREGIVQGEEEKRGINKVLTSAAWTYVAGAVSAIGSLLYIVFIFFRRTPPKP